LIVKLARETGWGYTRILGELKKLETAAHACPVHKSLLAEIEIPVEFQYGARHIA